LKAELKGPRYEERRANIRLSRVLAVALKVDDERRSCVAVDISVGGFQVATSYPVEVGRIIGATLHLSKHYPVEVSAQVIWCHEMELNLFRLGFQIEEVSSQEDFERLCRYVDKESLTSAALPENAAEPTLDLSTQVTLRTMSQEELDRFAALAQISELLNSCHQLEALLDRALKIVVEATGAERGMMLLDRGGRGFEVPAYHNKGTDHSRDYSQSVVDRVRDTQQPLLSLDAQRDERLASSSSLKVMGTRSVLCLPIENRNQNYGMLYLDNSVRAGALTQSDLKLASVLAVMAASAIGRAEDFAQLVHSEKMAAIGTLTAGFLHELSSPLTAILGIGEELHSEVGGELTRSLMEEAKRCDRLVDDLLRLFRKEPIEKGNIAVEELIRSAAFAVEAECKRKGVQLQIHRAKETPQVWGNFDHLRQVLVNLLSNALFEVRNQQEPLVELRVVNNRDSVVLVVADNGPGISPEHLTKVFDPFFTTKSKGEGTGLGLSIIARIVQEHGGSVKVENRSSGGALFQVSLPVSSADSPQAS